MTEEEKEALFKRALQAVKKFLEAKKDFEEVEDLPVTDIRAVSSAGRFVESHEEMLTAVAELEAAQKKLSSEQN